MKIIICNMMEQHLEFQVNPNDTVLQLKQLFCEKEGSVLANCRLTHGQDELHDNQTIQQANLKEGDIVYYSMHLGF
ncbi:unnamed protein product (macronuclear) [Paramecium tetraurelia]|uniref:Ubiquitin-like domain-containing protein n=2 Tax=Paramecium TaxID=5884 RepID=A0EDR3_PARTE|nr:uncharacterized protein GSPATT00025774001 [Paramecium tetraurelia]CAD8190320.1 unnamed protein product [Paramecium octaurelia]CAK93430.1 unnamed protein product [Paramecium tetraurelia]|eukprot:XP_001460827.1 hypothetical protein (macronuclear) [Paramecium tetraurelia strain d4-2]